MCLEIASNKGNDCNPHANHLMPEIKERQGNHNQCNVIHFSATINESYTYHNSRALYPPSSNFIQICH